MTIVTVTNLDGTTSELDMNTDSTAHAVDATGAYLGVVTLSGSAFQVPSAPPPADAWLWSFALTRWVFQPTLPQKKAIKAAPRLAQLAALDAAQVRSLAECVSALSAGGAAPAGSVAILDAYEVAKVPIRVVVAAINAATTLVELDAY